MDNTLTIKLCGVFSPLVKGGKLTVPHSSNLLLKDVIYELDKAFIPGLYHSCMNENQQIKDGIVVLVDGRVVSQDAEVKYGSTVTFMTAISGG